MRTLFLTAAGAALLLPVAAAADVTVTIYGNTPARSCYEAARDHRLGNDSVAHCEAALRDHLGPRDRVATLVNRGILRMLRDEHAGAREDFDLAIQLDPDQPEAFLNKAALVMRTQGPPDQAIALLDTALEKRTGEPAKAYYMRGIANEERGDIPAAYHDYRQAVALAPDWELPARELTRFQVRAGGP